MNKNIKRKRLLEVIERQNKSAYEVAQEIGYKPQTVYNWLYGKGVPNPVIMLKLKQILNVTGDEIIEIFAEGIYED